MEGVLGGAISTWKDFLGPIKKGGLSKLRCSAQKILPFTFQNHAFEGVLGGAISKWKGSWAVQ